MKYQKMLVDQFEGTNFSPYIKVPSNNEDFSLRRLIFPN
jgi:hypothetical protein